MDDGYDLLAVRIRRGTTIDGAIVALCPDEHGVVTADVCIDGPPVAEAEVNTPLGGLDLVHVRTAAMAETPLF